MDGITRGLAIVRVVVTNALQSRLVELIVATNARVGHLANGGQRIF